MINAIKNVINGTPLEPPARWLRAKYRKCCFRWTMRRVLSDPVYLLKNREILAELVRLWGNEPCSAAVDYVADCLKYTAQSRLPVLECGSGLTTILAGLIARENGIIIWSLEHSKAWHSNIARYLKKYGIKSVRLHFCPLKDYGEYCWYNPGLDSMPDRFSLVICDGPPRKNKGGRYGLLPVMKRKLVSGCVIILDDADWDIEQTNVERWSREFGVSFEKFGTDRHYFIINVPVVEE